MRPILIVPQKCVACQKSVDFETMTSPSIGAPVMARVPAGVWFGVVTDREDPEGHVTIVFVCSEECCQKVLEE